MLHFFRVVVAMSLACSLFVTTLCGQDKSVRPGINDTFQDPDVTAFVGRFEVESREVYARRQQIVAACGLKPGQTVADVGAGTGLFTRLFADAVGPEGLVIAVDISQKFLDHIAMSSREAGRKNIQTVLCKPDSTELAAESIDVAFLCDTYHHFEFPYKTMASLVRALKPGGQVILIDFRRVEGESSEWILSHVRAGQDVFEREILESGLRKLQEERELLQENYFVVFEKPQPAAGNGGPPGRGRGMGMGMGRGMGRGMGMGRGPGAEMRDDHDVFHLLLEKHDQIRRTVKRLPNGVETLTESDDPEIAGKIQEHVAAMHLRVKSGQGLRYWDELFQAIFANYKKIKMEVENTEKGVRVREFSDDPQVVALIQAHADVVSRFVKHGFDEAHQNHPVPKATAEMPPLVFPLIAEVGGVLPRPDAVEQPRKGAKVVFDVTANTPSDQINKGLDRVARLLNLYGAAGHQASDVRIVVVLHGEATKSVLKDADYQRRFDVMTNPNLPLIRSLQKAGVEILVCGQALNYKGFADSEVASGVPIAAAALTVVINKQADGYAYLPVP